MEQLGGGVRKGVDWVYLELDRIQQLVRVNTVVPGLGIAGLCEQLSGS
jgi:hypothetical protein